jgi:hypothetical protein
MLFVVFKHVYYYYHSVLSCSQVCGLIMCKCGNKKQREEIRNPITLLELLLGELVHLLLFLVFVGHDIMFLLFFFGLWCFVHLMVLVLL